MNLFSALPSGAYRVTGIIEYRAGLGYMSICPDQCTYDTKSAHIERQFVRIQESF